MDRRMETSLGGSARDFPSTVWSRFLGEANRTPEARAASLQELSASYWKPIYAYIRSRFASSNDDAKDLTQDFFLWMMETDFLTRPDPARGRFRGFVKTALHNYFLNDERAKRTLKRGGDRKLLALDGVDMPEIPAAAGGAPEDVLNYFWRSELISRATHRLEEECRREGKEVRFRLFQDFHLRAGEPPTYRDAAATYSLNETKVTNNLFEARQRFREIIKDLVAETVETPGALEEELRSLFGGEWK